MTQPFKHAKFIHAWADGADIQYFDDYVNEWILIGESHVWCDDNEYRFRPKMIKCGDLEFPEPMRVAPEIGVMFWLIKPTSLVSLAHQRYWDGTDAVDMEWLHRGLCHTTQAAAEAHARALIALTEVQ